MSDLKIKDAPQRTGSGEIIEFLKQTVSFEDVLKDEEGVFALISDQWIVTGKGYIYGNIVSCHKRAVASAMNQGKKLLMYIEDPDKFYQFDPEEVWEEGRDNKKGDVKMLNFKINLGERVKRRG